MEVHLVRLLYSLKPKQKLMNFISQKSLKILKYYMEIFLNSKEKLLSEDLKKAAFTFW